METKRIIKTLGLFSLIGAAGLLTWWFLMPLFLPVHEANENFQNLVLDRNWLFINLIGLFSSLMLVLGFPGFYLTNYEKFNKAGFTGLILASAGLILFTGIQYYETLLWPVVAGHNPELLSVHGALVTGDMRVVSGLVVSGIILSAGYIMFGIPALKIYKKTPVWFLITGATVFGNGVVFPVRTIGLILFCSGTIWLAVNIRKLTYSNIES